MATLTKTVDKVADITRAIRALTRNELLIGVPEEKTDRQDGEITNAAIGYIQENGAPEINLPARPHLVPGVMSAAPQMIQVLKTGAEQAFDGNPTAARQSLEAAGLIGRNAVVALITSNIPPPLSPRTLAERSRKAKRQLTLADVTALIDSGQYRAAHTYVVRPRQT